MNSDEKISGNGELSLRHTPNISERHVFTDPSVSAGDTSLQQPSESRRAKLSGGFVSETISMHRYGSNQEVANLAFYLFLMNLAFSMVRFNARTVRFHKAILKEKNEIKANKGYLPRTRE